MKHLNEASPMEIKRSLESLLPTIEEVIKSQKRDITVDTVSQVASISAEDKKIGDTIQEIYQKIGPKGIIHWDISKTAEDSYTIGTGLEIVGATYASPYMGDMISPTEFSAVANIKEPLVALIRQKITTGADFGNLFQNLNSKGVKDIVIFCDEIEVPAIVHFILTQQQRGFRSLVIKMPTLWKDEWWEDLSLASGARIIDALSGIQIKDITEEHLGKFGHIRVTKENTFIDGIQNMTQHIADLIAEGSDKSILRASRLNTQTARYFVGAISEQALYYKRLKVEDAINAASCALENGVVPGGGVALLNVSKQLKDTEIGGKILKGALMSPINQIILNTGRDLTEKIEILEPEKGFELRTGKITEVIEGAEGFDSRTGEIVNMFDAGIVDPTDVVINSIKNAIGVAASILTIGTVITLPIEERSSTNN
jgi:chaperonin GroEL